MASLPLVYVGYDRTPAGRRAIEYAASLAVPYGELRLLLPAAPSGPSDRAAIIRETQPLLGAHAGIVGWGRADRTDVVLCSGEPETFDFGPGAIVVSNRLRRADVTVLAPQDAFRVAEHRPSALVPLGNRESGAYAVDHGLPLLRQVDCHRVVFYHTTYRKEDVASDDPRDHLDAGASALLAYARQTALTLGIAAETHVEMVSQVADGTCMAALTEHCALILMARGLERRGIGYVDEVLDGSPVPVLVLGREVSR